VERFESKFVPEPNSGCWLWEGETAGHGYGRFSLGPAGNRERWAHRCSWMLFRGEIPDGKHVLHTCHNPGCVNPDHLYIGTQADNNRDTREAGHHNHSRKTHCIHGHPLSGENVYLSPQGWRRCKTCRREWSAARREARQ
jgi:hypothetical protein